MPKKLNSRSGAPLVQTDITELGDRKLSYEENLHRERERAWDQAAKYKLKDQDELVDVDRSMGPRLYYTEIIRRVQKLNPAIKVLDGMEGNVAIYRPRTGKEYAETNQLDPQKDLFFWHHIYATGMEKGWIPEWGHLTADESKVANREVRGWRSVLIALIRAGAVTYSQAVKEFGDPTLDRRSDRWFQKLARYMPV